MPCEMAGRVIKVEVDGKFLISKLINANIDSELKKNVSLSISCLPTHIATETIGKCCQY